MPISGNESARNSGADRTTTHVGSVLPPVCPGLIIPMIVVVARRVVRCGK